MVQLHRASGGVKKCCVFLASIKPPPNARAISSWLCSMVSTLSAEPSRASTSLTHRHQMEVSKNQDPKIDAS